MCHVSKLFLSGKICNRGKKVSSNYTWPNGERQSVVEEMIAKYRKAFCDVNVVIHHRTLD